MPDHWQKQNRWRIKLGELPPRTKQVAGIRETLAGGKAPQNARAFSGTPLDNGHRAYRILDLVEAIEEYMLEAKLQR